MNLIEARKLGHEGWVRSPTRTEGKLVNARGGWAWSSGDLDAEDWEPKHAPPKPFDAGYLDNVVKDGPGRFSEAR